VKGLCEKVGFSRQAFYQEKKARKRKHVDKDAVIELVKSQRRIHPRMGTRKLHNIIEPVLNDMGLNIGRDRFFRMLRESGLLIERL
jgi:predicted nucleic-acid-binding protein